MRIALIEVFNSVVAIMGLAAFIVAHSTVTHSILPGMISDLASDRRSQEMTSMS